jgi:hypothetical protein
MKFSSSIIAALVAVPLVSAAPAPFPKVEKKWVDTNSGFTGIKVPTHFASSFRKIAREKAVRKRQLDALLGQLTGGAGGAGGAAAGGAGGAGGLDQLLGGLTGGAAGGKAAGGAAAGGEAAGGAAAGGKAAGGAAAGGKAAGGAGGAGGLGQLLSGLTGGAAGGKAAATGAAATAGAGKGKAGKGTAGRMSTPNVFKHSMLTNDRRCYTRNTRSSSSEQWHCISCRCCQWQREEGQGGNYCWQW